MNVIHFKAALVHLAYTRFIGINRRLIILTEAVYINMFARILLMVCVIAGLSQALTQVEYEAARSLIKTAIQNHPGPNPIHPTFVRLSKTQCFHLNQ